VTVERATRCRRPFAVELWTVNGGGHTWPGGKQYLPKAVIEPVSHQFVFEDAALDFFLGG
jgi:polyhydroxybutyrate depolymerase